jgi:hypothetical protein
MNVAPCDDCVLGRAANSVAMNKQALMPLKHIVMHSGQDWVSSAASDLSQDRRA